MLSRRHCVLFDKGEELYLCDEGSLNGTHFKGALAEEPVRLQFGDEFTVGYDLKFRVSAPETVEPGTDRYEVAGQTTVVFALNAKGEWASHQSTMLPEQPANQD
jgi:pSer/pThr/pTyr-binding forkhead associated (FHA) protein